MMITNISEANAQFLALIKDEGPVVIEDYGYELWHYMDKIAWYDAQPHIDDSEYSKFGQHKTVQ